MVTVCVFNIGTGDICDKNESSEAVTVLFIVKMLIKIKFWIKRLHRVSVVYFSLDLVLIYNPGNRFKRLYVLNQIPLLLLIHLHTHKKKIRPTQSPR